MDTRRFQSVLDKVNKAKERLMLAGARVEKCMAEGTTGSTVRARAAMADAHVALTEAKGHVDAAHVESTGLQTKIEHPPVDETPR